MSSTRGSSSLRAAGLVSALTLLSRVLGVVREQVFAALLGAGMHADAFQIGFRIPNLLRDLFAEGALSAAFVPTYARLAAQEGRPSAQRMASRLLTLLAVILGGVVIVGVALAGSLVAALAPGFEAVPGKWELTVRLTRIMLPFLPLVSFAAVAMGMLNAEGKYGPAALAPAMFNVMTIVWGLCLWRMKLGSDLVVVGWAVGTLLGGVAQFATQVPGLRRQGWRFRPEWAPADPWIRRIAALMAPATAGLAAVQVNIFVNSIFASRDPGAVSWLNYAFRILYLPIGIFGVAAGTVATTSLARRAATGDLPGLRGTLRGSLRMLAFVTIPSTVGLMILAGPIVRLLYERGRFHGEDTARTAAALLFYAAGLVAYSSIKVLAPAFYALSLPSVALVASGLSVATNLLLNLALYPQLGYRSVALGTSVGAFLNAGFLFVAFEKRFGGLTGRGLTSALGRMLAATAAMAATSWWTAAWVESTLGGAGLAARLASVFLPVGAGVLTYGLAAHVLRVPEMAALLAIVRHRRAEGIAAAP